MTTEGAWEEARDLRGAVRAVIEQGAMPRPALGIVLHGVRLCAVVLRPSTALPGFGPYLEAADLASALGAEEVVLASSATMLSPQRPDSDPDREVQVAQSLLVVRGEPAVMETEILRLGDAGEVAWEPATVTVLTTPDGGPVVTLLEAAVAGARMAGVTGLEGPPDRMMLALLARGHALSVRPLAPIGPHCN